MLLRFGHGGSPHHMCLQGSDLAPGSRSRGEAPTADTPPVESGARSISVNASNLEEVWDSDKSGSVCLNVHAWRLNLPRRDTFAMSRVKANWRRIATWFDGFKAAGEGWSYLQSWESPPATIGTMAALTSVCCLPHIMLSLALTGLIIFMVRCSDTNVLLVRTRHDLDVSLSLKGGQRSLPVIGGGVSLQSHRMTA